MSKVTATWVVELNCDCPGCGNWVNLMDLDGFWEQHEKLEVPEHGTPRTVDMEVECPGCNHEFKVDLEY